MDLLRTIMLGRGKGVTLDEVAHALGVSSRSARRYLERFDQTEYELERVPSRGEHLRWRIKSQERPTKIALRRAQVFCLLAGRHMFEPLKGSALYDEVQLAVRQLLTVANRPGRGPNAGIIDTSLEDRFVYLPAQPVTYHHNRDSVDVFYHAVAGLHPVTCLAQTPERPSELLTLHPYALVMYQDALLVVAAVVPGPSPTAAPTEPMAPAAPVADASVEGSLASLQTFALEQLTDAKLHDTTEFRLSKRFHLRALYQGLFGLYAATKPVAITIDFDPAVAPQLLHRQVHPSQRLSHLKAGGLRLTFRAEVTASLVQWIRSFGPHARVIEPEALRQRILQDLHDTLAKYR